MSASISLGQTMVEWHVYLNRWSITIKHRCSKEVCMQVIVVMLFLLPEFERMNVLYTLRRAEERAVSIG